MTFSPLWPLFVLLLVTYTTNEPFPCSPLLLHYHHHLLHPPSPIPVFTLQPFSGAISRDNSTHKSSAGQWSPWNWCAFISKQWRRLMRGAHDVITLAGDRAGRCILAPRMGNGPMKSPGKDNLIIRRIATRLWCKQPADTLNHIPPHWANWQPLLWKPKPPYLPRVE